MMGDLCFGFGAVIICAACERARLRLLAFYRLSLANCLLRPQIRSRNSSLVASSWVVAQVSRLASEQSTSERLLRRDFVVV